MESKPRDKWDWEISGTLLGHWQVQDNNSFAEMLSCRCRPRAGHSPLSPRTRKYFWGGGSFYTSQKSCWGLCCALRSLCTPGVSLSLQQLDTNLDCLSSLFNSPSGSKGANSLLSLPAAWCLHRATDNFQQILLLHILSITLGTGLIIGSPAARFILFYACSFHPCIRVIISSSDLTMLLSCFKTLNGSQSTTGWT